jgi:hypothetical protein
MMQQPQQPLLQDGIRTWVESGSGASLRTMASSSASPSVLLSVQEYRTPTAEELAQKKMTFNMIFWGGGFVAPFLATIFYFGFKFWER